MTFQELEQAVSAYNPEADLEMIRLAYDFADSAHRGQVRKTGEDYIQHLLKTAHYLSRMQVDDETIIAALLHEVPDLTTVTVDAIRKDFGADVATLVDGVSRLGSVKYRGIDRYVENLRKMFVSIAQDTRIILIKFAGRIHNLETLSVLPEQKQLRIATEVLEIYAPIADRLGIAFLRGELEDRAFPFVYPEEYAHVKALVDPHLQQKEQYLDRVREILEQYLVGEGIEVMSISSRVKRLFSTYKKMKTLGLATAEGLYDLVAMRVIVPTVADCYAALGVIHQYWKPLKGRIKDYIAQPKPNNYRSLHTTVFCEDGQIVEFQIRTPEMQYEAEVGIAAHWHYTESQKISKKITAKQLDWVQEILTFQGVAGTTNQEYLKALKLDIFQHRIFVFTPKGDVINLPADSTPVDFAFHIHSDVGRRCSGARINDALVSLDTPLKSGDVVEIIIEKNRKTPSIDWLTFVKTHIARSHIKQQLRRR